MRDYLRRIEKLEEKVGRPGCRCSLAVVSEFGYPTQEAFEAACAAKDRELDCPAHGHSKSLLITIRSFSQEWRSPDTITEPRDQFTQSQVAQAKQITGETSWRTDTTA